MMFELVIIALLSEVILSERPSPPAIETSKSVNAPTAKCEFTVHKDGPKGPLVSEGRTIALLYGHSKSKENGEGKVGKISSSMGGISKVGVVGDVVQAWIGTALDVELYYKIQCNPHDGYCLLVANCTLSSDEAGFKPYPIIDKLGCSLEPSLYDNVEYLSTYTAGIRNPYPVRFRSSSGAVLLYCVTTLIPTEMDGTCPRSECAKHSTDS